MGNQNMNHGGENANCLVLHGLTETADGRPDGNRRRSLEGVSTAGDSLLTSLAGPDAGGNALHGGL